MIQQRVFNPIISGETTIEEEVPPILTTSLSLALSFLCFTNANFIPLAEFGLLSSYVLVLAVFSDLYIGPATLAYFVTRNKGLKGLSYPPTFECSQIKARTCF